MLPRKEKNELSLLKTFYSFFMKRDVFLLLPKIERLLNFGKINSIFKDSKL